MEDKRIKSIQELSENGAEIQEEEIINEESSVCAAGTTPAEAEITPADGEEQKLDDARRVKYLSPTALVFKRFFRNKLAVTGIIILAVLFAFCFLGSAIYPYREADVFMTIREIEFDYSFAKINEDYNNVYSENSKTGAVIRTMTNSYIKNDMQPYGLTEFGVTDPSSDKRYVIRKLNDNIYTVNFEDFDDILSYKTEEAVGSYTARGSRFIVGSGVSEELKNALTQAFEDAGGDVLAVSVTLNGNVYTLSDGKIVCAYGEPVTVLRTDDVTDELFEAAVSAAEGDFSHGGADYKKAVSSGLVTVSTEKSYVDTVATSYVFDRYDLNDVLTDNFRFNALIAIGLGNADFVSDSHAYGIYSEGENTVITCEKGGKTVPYAEPTVYSVRRYSGQDTISVATKKAMSAIMMEMKEEGLVSAKRTIKMEALDEDGNYVLDEDGEIVFDDEEFSVKSENKGMGQQFVFRNMQEKQVADIFAAPSSEHVLGLDGNAMDVLARMMYGGRVSLLIGFIVVFIEIILGTIMGGISGYFGKAVDNIIMRIVDVFYCIPTMPILIILGAVFDQMRLPNVERVIWMMAVLGFLGWPGIARLVRGQILSLREQDFMIAAEASGLTSRRKIFRHLIPNVIPQLIVQATMGLGGVIITESTLSFLGLGVKFPMATWGQIINSVSSLSEMTKYTYIWIPVGSLICLAVIAFNFVGDGLRDAFDPKMNR